MKKVICIIFCFLSTVPIWSQQLQSNILADISEAQAGLPRKPTLVYTYVTWCGGNADDIETIYGVLKEFREKYNLIVLLDSAKQGKTSPLILDLKPDAFIFLNPYYPTCFIKKKEYKQFAKDFNACFGTSEVYMGPGSLFIVDCNAKLVRVLNEPDRVNEIKATIPALSENCIRVVK